MKLDYASLISPYPLRLEHIGSIKSPTLREIFQPQITYKGYQLCLSLLSMTPKTYCEKMDPSRNAWYQSLSEEEQNRLTMFDLIEKDASLQISYQNALNFFFVETVAWDTGRKAFVTRPVSSSHPAAPSSLPSMTADPAGIAGLIHREVFPELCDVILQRCGIQRAETEADPSQVKNERALAILKKIQAGRLKQKTNLKNDEALELPNLIAAVCVKSRSLNYTNIWDLTVYQLYDQFRREQADVYFDIQKMSVAAYGNKEKHFRGDEWYKNN
jgi:hypothetical protein